MQWQTEQIKMYIAQPLNCTSNESQIGSLTTKNNNNNKNNPIFNSEKPGSTNSARLSSSQGDLY